MLHVHGVGQVAQVEHFKASCIAGCWDGSSNCAEQPIVKEENVASTSERLQQDTIK